MIKCVSKKHITVAIVSYMGALALFLQTPPIGLTPPAPLLIAPPVPATVLETVLKLVPQDRNVIVDNEFTLTIAVDAAQLVNAVSAAINFPKDYLEVIKLSKEGSMLTVWPEDPAFSNEIGTITFSGINLDGGAKGERTVLRVILKAKKTGEAKITFSSAQVLAHDGLGTDVVKQKIGVTYTIANKRPAPPADVNGDGKIGIADVSIVVFYMGKTGATAAKYDLSGDGKVTLTDLSILVSMMARK